MAWEAPHRAHHRASQEKRLVARRRREKIANFRFSRYLRSNGRADPILPLRLLSVPWRGGYLGSLKLVSNVRKYPTEPRWYHRSVTVAFGILSALFGIGSFIFVFVLSGLK